MARPRVIDRDELLDIAERCVAEHGAAALTFGSLATAAGLSKGSVQTVFGTREHLLETLIARWMSREEVRFNEALGDDESPAAHVLAHLNTTKQESVEVGRTVLTMLAALTGDGNTSKTMNRWYVSRLGSLEAASADERRFRIAYLAAEGAFLVRNLIGMTISDERWAEIFDDLEKLVVRPTEL